MFTIRAMQPTDWPSIRRIYEQGIATGMATMVTEAPDWLSWDSAHLSKCRLVAEDDDKRVLGWAALTAVDNPCFFRGIAELSVYVSEDARGQHIGTELLKSLVEESEKAGYWTLQAQILAGNQASIHLHEVVGFRQVGRRERIGKLGGSWRDVVLLERRSELVGVD